MKGLRRKKHCTKKKSNFEREEDHALMATSWHKMLWFWTCFSPPPTFGKSSFPIFRAWKNNYIILGFFFLKNIFSQELFSFLLFLKSCFIPPKIWPEYWKCSETYISKIWSLEQAVDTLYHTQVLWVMRNYTTIFYYGHAYHSSTPLLFEGG